MTKNPNLSQSPAYNVLIIGGGLAGLTAAAQLAEAGSNVLVLEKKAYPFHKVCGEYISNEVRPFLARMGADLEQFDMPEIDKLEVSTPSGKTINAHLAMGAFGISRYAFDQHLVSVAKQKGAEVWEGTEVNDVRFDGRSFTVTTRYGSTIQAPIVIGSYGKRSGLDKTLNRPFINERTGYMAVKYHIHIDFPDDKIALHNFKDGYCGMSKVEGNRYCLCYLTKRSNLLEYGTIPDMEKQVLHKNPHLRDIMKNASFLYEKPLVINEISFSPKETIADHILMTGDASGLITPLCGNGMAMAIHGGKLLAETLREHSVLHRQQLAGQERQQIEAAYAAKWQRQFGKRLKAGRMLQAMFGHPGLTNITLPALGAITPLKNYLISATHGTTIE